MAAQMVYVGKLACGCWTFAGVDSPENMKSIAKALARVVRQHGSIHRMTVDEVRESKEPWAHACTHGKAKTRG